MIAPWIPSMGYDVSDHAVVQFFREPLGGILAHRGAQLLKDQPSVWRNPVNVFAYSFGIRPHVPPFVITLEAQNRTRGRNSRRTGRPPRLD